MATHLMKMMTTYLIKLCLIEYVLDEVNLMYLQCVQKTMKKGIQIYVWAKALKKYKTRGNHHGIDPLYWVMIRLNDPVQEYHRK